jgi:hypothetical protein
MDGFRKGNRKNSFGKVKESIHFPKTILRNESETSTEVLTSNFEVIFLRFNFRFDTFLWNKGINRSKKYLRNRERTQETTQKLWH